MSFFNSQSMRWIVAALAAGTAGQDLPGEGHWSSYRCTKANTPVAAIYLRRLRSLQGRSDLRPALLRHAAGGRSGKLAALRSRQSTLQTTSPRFAACPTRRGLCHQTPGRSRPVCSPRISGRLQYGRRSCRAQRQIVPFARSNGTSSYSGGFRRSATFPLRRYRTASMGQALALRSSRGSRRRTGRLLAS